VPIGKAPMHDLPHGEVYPARAMVVCISKEAFAACTVSRAQVGQVLDIEVYEAEIAVLGTATLPRLG
jgi:hypothetical protein